MLTYVENIPANKLVNVTDPKNQLICTHAAWKSGHYFDEQYVELREKIGQYYIDRLNDFNGFYTKLEESIKKEGILNPVMATTGIFKHRKKIEIPPSNIKTDTYVEYSGGSRIYVAQKLNLNVNMIVTDYLSLWQGQGEKINTADDVYDKFKAGKPSKIILEGCVRIEHPPYYHLNDGTTANTLDKLRYAVNADIFEYLVKSDLVYDQLPQYFGRWFSYRREFKNSGVIG